MKRFALASLVVALVGTPTAPAGAEGPPPCVAGELVLLADRALSEDGRLRELSLDSAALRGETRVRVLLPDGYRDVPGKARGLPAYPVLHLLHGVGDDERTWTTKTVVEELTSDLDVIVVMPDGGRTPHAGWYSDWETREFCWESFHVGELLGFVDDRYRTVDTREGRAVAGASMGGFGAMSYAARHPDLFVSAGSFSGAVDTADGGPAEAAAFELASPVAGTPDDRVWGPYETNEVEWRDHNPPDLSTNLRWTDLWLSTGNGVPMPGDSPANVPTESGVYTLNQLFHQDLKAEGIPHVFEDRGHGTHEWHYWEADLEDYLAHLDGVFASPSSPPEVFDHRRASEGPFEVWGWRIAPDPVRPQEFLELTGVSPDGLTLRGSGSTDVLTAPVFDPGDEYLVNESRVTADADGRLSFTVDLGPPHESQQYTPTGRAAEASDPGYWRTVKVTISAAD